MRARREFPEDYTITITQAQNGYLLVEPEWTGCAYKTKGTVFQSLQALLVHVFLYFDWKREYILNIEVIEKEDECYAG